MRLLSMRISSWRVCSACTPVPYACSAWFVGTSFKFGIFMLTLSIRVRNCMVRMMRIRVRNWCECWAYASVPDSYAQGTHQFLVRMLSIFNRNALCARISTWCVCSVHAPVPDSYAQLTHQFLTHMLSARIGSWRACSVHESIPYAHAEGIQNEHLKNRKTDAYAEHARKELMHMLRVRISSWRARSGCACSACA
jgi:hypothetical protein